jgi:predicted nucleic acid-binding protein
MRSVIVCDTGPLLHLSEAGLIGLLQQAGDVHIPPKVQTELERYLPDWKPAEWLDISHLEGEHVGDAQSWVRAEQLDPGEAEAVGLALQLKADWLLTDDAQARQFAETLGLEVHGSIGLLLWAVAWGHLSNRKKAYESLDALANSSLWVSERVLREARKAIDLLALD